MKLLNIEAFPLPTPMLTVHATISRVRRDLTLGALLKLAIAMAVFACVLIGPEVLRILGLIVIALVWVWLSLKSARGSRMAAQSPMLIATGQFEEAERNIEQAVRGFSIFPAVKLQALHHLAILRHAQRRWQESAQFSQALLNQRLGALQPISRSTRLLLADSLLEMNDLRGAYQALLGLQHEQLGLQERLNLLLLELEYLTRIGAWEWIVRHCVAKVSLLELLPASASARAQALCSLAAKRAGRGELSDWLRSRAQLLADIERLTSDRPMLKELWP